VKETIDIHANMNTKRSGEPGVIGFSPMAPVSRTPIKDWEHHNTLTIRLSFQGMIRQDKKC